MFFKRRISFQKYCAASIKAAFEHSDEATGEAFRRSCGDSFLNAAELQLYLDHLRAVFIELMLIAIAKNCNMDTSLQAHIFVKTHIEELGFPQINGFCHDYSQAFASSNADGIKLIVLHFNNAVTAGQMRQETLERLNAEFYAVLMSHYKDFKSIKMTIPS